MYRINQFQYVKLCNQHILAVFYYYVPHYIVGYGQALLFAASHQKQKTLSLLKDTCALMLCFDLLIDHSINYKLSTN